MADFAPGRALVVFSLLLGAASAALGQLAPVLAPPENPVTEAKRVLGKALFFDEQLSSDSTTACATCHIPGRGGTDPRIGVNPGDDGLIGTPDDVRGSPGVVRATFEGGYDRDAVFGLLRQITGRAANSTINAGYAPELFWDGRASGTFTDPETGAVVIASGGALESQVVGPPVSDVEMAHEARDWGDITRKLASARPLALATNLPPDLSAALADEPTYQELFAEAFGDGRVSAARIAMAIATYERTLVSDDTPWDRFMAGEPGAMTPQQVQGWQAFQASRCNACHTAPLFTDQSFRNIGLRPVTEDPGRQDVTGLFADRGKFKTPSLRNAGLKRTFMHNGQFTNIGQVVGFYARAPGAPPQFPDNRDPLMQLVNVPPQVAPLIIDFVANALTDPRVANQVFPFDKPVLFGERPADQPSLIGTGVAGTGGVPPRMIALTPPLIGSVDFALGLDGGVPGASAMVYVSRSAPVNGVIGAEETFGPFTVEGAAGGPGQATLQWPLEVGSYADGEVVFAQWVVDDPLAAGGQARSPVARIEFFCGLAGCRCPADVDEDERVTALDLLAFLNGWFGGAAWANLDASAAVDVFDLLGYLDSWFAGC